jgi:hypothetical protein
VIAALGSRINVVDVHKNGVPTTGHTAALRVALKNAAANRRRDGLTCPLLSMFPMTHVGTIIHRGNRRPEMLRITPRHRDEVSVNLDGLPFSRLKPTLTVLAYRERNLIAGPTFVSRPTEHVPCEKKHGGIVV